MNHNLHTFDLLFLSVLIIKEKISFITYSHFSVLTGSTLISLSGIGITSLTISLIISIFANLLGLFNRFHLVKYSDKGSFDRLCRKISSCSFDNSLCFNIKTACYDDNIIIYILVRYNMNFIEYPKKEIYTCFDGCDGNVILLFKDNDQEYFLVEYLHKNRELVNAFKKLLKLKDKNTSLNLIICMILDQFDKNFNKNKIGEFEYAILPERDRHLKFDLKKSILVFIYLLMIDAIIIHMQVK